MTPLAVRMFTSFHVQCSVSKFRPERRMLKGPPERALPQAVQDDDIDVLVIQAPRSRDLSPYAISVLSNCATSVLIYPPQMENTALGQLPLPTDSFLPRIPSVSLTPQTLRVTRQILRCRTATCTTAFGCAGARVALCKQAHINYDKAARVLSDVLASCGTTGTPESPTAAHGEPHQRQL